MYCFVTCLFHLMGCVRDLSISTHVDLFIQSFNKYLSSTTVDFIVVQQIFTLLSPAPQGKSIFPCPVDVQLAHMTCLGRWNVDGRIDSMSDPSRSFQRHCKFC